MYIEGCLLLAVVTAGLSAPSAGTLSVKLNVHKRHSSRDQYSSHLASLQGKGHGEIPLEVFCDNYYFGEVKVGSPGQVVNLLFDTAYGDTYMPSSEVCKKDKEFCKNHKVYNERKSKTYKKNGTSWSTDYYPMRGSGHLSQDSIEIGGLVVKKQLFAVITANVLPLMEATFDGVLGLTYRAGSTIDSNPFFVNMIEQKVVDQPVFSLYLQKRVSDSAGELVLGGVDSNHYTGDITYTPVIKPSYWFINIDGFKLKSKKMTGKFLALVHPNTGEIYGPVDVMDKINWALDGERQWDGSYTVDCNKLSSLPDANIIIGGRSFSLTPSEYTNRVHREKGDVCYTAFYGMPGLKHFIIGNTFLRKFYSVFDMGKNRVGFATAK